MASLRLQVRSSPREGPRDDEGEGTRLRGWVTEALRRGRPPVVAVVVRVDRVDLVGLQPVVEAGIPMSGFLAGLTRSTIDGAGPPEAVGVMGVLHARSSPGDPGPGVPMAVAFLEWEDCRWWQWKALLDPEEGGIREDSSTVNRAVDGDPLPHAFGRWWSLGRRANMSMHLSRSEPEQQPESSPLVH